MMLLNIKHMMKHKKMRKICGKIGICYFTAAKNWYSLQTTPSISSEFSVPFVLTFCFIDKINIAIKIGGEMGKIYQISGLQIINVITCKLVNAFILNKH